jgi:hypothetical protein
VFRACARDTCPAAVRVDCAQFDAQADGAIPTFVLRARDEAGRDVVGMHVTVDGAPLATYEEGRPFELDPGPHTLRVESGARSVELKVVAREKEKARPVAVTFPAPSAPPAASAAPSKQAPPQGKPAGRPIPTAAWVLGGLGVLGLGSFITFGIVGFEKHSALRNSCAPRCTDDSIRPVHIDYAIGDISLAVSVASFGVATYLLATRPAARSASGLAIGIGPRAATIAGAF